MLLYPLGYTQSQQCLWQGPSSLSRELRTLFGFAQRRPLKGVTGAYRTGKNPAQHFCHSCSALKISELYCIFVHFAVNLNLLFFSSILISKAFVSALQKDLNFE